MKLVWLPEARDDLLRLFEFLLERDAEVAERALLLIREGASALLETPRLGKRMDDDTERREWFVPFGVSAYVLRYRIHDETLVVIRVWHSREARL